MRPIAPSTRDLESRCASKFSKPGGLPSFSAVRVVRSCKYAESLSRGTSRRVEGALRRLARYLPVIEVDSGQGRGESKRELLIEGNTVPAGGMLVVTLDTLTTSLDETPFRYQAIGILTTFDLATCKYSW